VIARSERAVVALTDCVVFSNGFDVAITVLTRESMDPRMLGFGRPPQLGQPLPDDVLRIGIQYADGRKTTSLHAHAAGRREYMLALAEGRTPPEPEGPLMQPRGGGGGGTRWDHRFWVWPLPPPGPVKLACQWPSEGIALTFHELSGDQIRSAAAGVSDLWDDPPS